MHVYLIGWATVQYHWILDLYDLKMFIVYTQLQYSIMPHMPRHVGAVPCYHGILDSSPISNYYGILRIRTCVQVIRVYS